MIGVDPMLDRAQCSGKVDDADLCAAETGSHAAENVRNLRTEDRQNRDNDDRHQDEDQCVLNQALTFFAWKIHCCHPLSQRVLEFFNCPDCIAVGSSPQ